MRLIECDKRTQSNHCTARKILIFFVVLLNHCGWHLHFIMSAHRPPCVLLPCACSRTSGASPTLQSTSSLKAALLWQLALDKEGDDSGSLSNLLLVQTPGAPCPVVTHGAASRSDASAQGESPVATLVHTGGLPCSFSWGGGVLYPVVPAWA